MRKLFCEYNRFTYLLSLHKERMKRRIKNVFDKQSFAKEKSVEKLPVTIYKHQSLIRRKLGNVDMQLQENKAVNLNLAVIKLDGILIKPNETFSFWELVGSCTKRKGYEEGVVISKGKADKGIGGGMCQLTNLIHWMVLHSPLEVTEYHHHNGIDLFPDYNRQVPFGVGTSIFYNYLDYRFFNPTSTTYQLILYTTETYLCGELLALKGTNLRYHIDVDDEYFEQVEDTFYRNNIVSRRTIDVKTGNCIQNETIVKSHAKVMYEENNIPQEKIKIT